MGRDSHNASAEGANIKSTITIWNTLNYYWLTMFINYQLNKREKVSRVPRD